MSNFNLRYVTCVEPPRNGNALLVDYLREYFDDEWHYCEFYTACISAPCINKNTIFQRNHDFELDLENNPDSHYLVQMRHPLHSIVSHYERRVEIGVYGDDNVDVWIAHSLEWIKFFQAFCGKWVLNNPYENYSIITYEEILADPIQAIGSVIKFCAPNHTPDQRRLAELKDTVFVKKIRDPRKFKFFDSLQFALMELEILDILSVFGYRPQFLEQGKTNNFEISDSAQQYYLQKLMVVEPAIRRRSLWNTQTQLNLVIDQLNMKLEKLQEINSELLRENLKLNKVI